MIAAPRSRLSNVCAQSCRSLQIAYIFLGANLALHDAAFQNNRQGTALNARLRNPNRLFPHPSPKRSYKTGPMSGIRAPPSDLSIVLAASADAANSLN